MLLQKAQGRSAVVRSAPRAVRHRCRQAARRCPRARRRGSRRRSANRSAPSPRAGVRGAQAQPGELLAQMILQRLDRGVCRDRRLRSRRCPCWCCSCRESRECRRSPRARCRSPSRRASVPPKSPASSGVVSESPPPSAGRFRGRVRFSRSATRSAGAGALGHRLEPPGRPRRRSRGRGLLSQHLLDFPDEARAWKAAAAGSTAATGGVSARCCDSRKLQGGLHVRPRMRSRESSAGPLPSGPASQGPRRGPSWPPGIGQRTRRTRGSMTYIRKCSPR